MFDRNLIYGSEKVLYYGKIGKMEFFDRNLIYGIRNYQEKSYTTVKIEKWIWKNGKVEKWKIGKSWKKLQTMRPYATNCHLGLTHCPGF